jgi:hypothetical protein
MLRHRAHTSEASDYAPQLLPTKPHEATPASSRRILVGKRASSGLTKKAEPPPTRDVNPVKVRGPTGLYARDSGTDRANGGWLRRLVRPHGHISKSHLALVARLK